MLTFWVWWVFMGASTAIVILTTQPGASTNDKENDTAIVIMMALCWPLALMWAIRRK